MFHALVIGIDDFEDPKIRRLRYARKDAESVTRLLERIAPEERRVRTLLDSEATLREVEKRVDDLCADVREGDVALIYVASHGSPEPRSVGASPSAFLILHDTEYAYIHATGLDLETRIADWLGRLAKASLVAVILDTCFSGVAGGRTLAGKALRGEPVSLKGLDLGQGGVVITAADKHQPAREEESLGHGVFTYHLLEALQPPPGGPATIGVGTLYEQVAQAVRGATSGKQHPIFDGRTNLGALPVFPR